VSKNACGLAGQKSERARWRTRVRETLTARRSLLESLAKLLLEKEVVDRATLDELLAAEPRKGGTKIPAPASKPAELV